MVYIIKILLIFVVLFLYSFADDFIVIENPSALIIYDKFESPVDISEITEKFVPFKIIDNNWGLGDGVSEACKVICRGNEYYIRKDDSGDFEGLAEAGDVKIYSAIAINDTVSSVSSAKVLSGQYPGSRNNSNFTDLATTVFKYKLSYYLQNMKTKSSFGWSDKNSWQTKKKYIKKVAVKLDAYLEEQINTLIDDINKKYIKLFSFYNTKLNDSRVVPNWIVMSKGNTVKCELKGTSSYVLQLEESTGQIIQSLMTIVQGEPFDVDYNSGVITISPLVTQQ